MDGLPSRGTIFPRLVVRNASERLTVRNFPGNFMSGWGLNYLDLNFSQPGRMAENVQTYLVG